MYFSEFSLEFNCVFVTGWDFRGTWNFLLILYLHDIAAVWSNVREANR